MTNITDCYDIIISNIIKKNMITKKEFLSIVNDYDFNLHMEIAKSLGIPLFERNSNIYLKTNENITNQTLCFVDIETTGSISSSDIIEIGAIKYKNGMIIDKFNSFIYTSNIPSSITKITGITNEDVLLAPSLRDTLVAFKSFIYDNTFIAHNVNFDFDFINLKLSDLNLPIMKNRKLCTLALAKKTIQANKYGLGYLNEFLNINHPIRHRALDDSLISLRVFQHSLVNLPKYIKSVENLINFGMSNKK